MLRAVINVPVLGEYIQKKLSICLITQEQEQNNVDLRICKMGIRVFHGVKSSTHEEEKRDLTLLRSLKRGLWLLHIRTPGTLNIEEELHDMVSTNKNMRSIEHRRKRAT